MSKDPSLWYRDKDKLRIGEINRYILQYKRHIGSKISKIYFRLKNIENSGIRAIHLLSGPFILYCHVVPCNYNPKKKFEPDNVNENPELVFENQIKPNQSFNVELILNDNSLLETVIENDMEAQIFQWEIDVVSQIVVTKKTEVDYDFLIGDDPKVLKQLGYNKIQRTLTSIGMSDEEEKSIEKDLELEGMLKKSFNPSLSVTKLSTNDIWSRSPPNPKEPVHLIILTHGIFSNLTADMLFLKEELESKVNENIMIRGFRYNAGRTEKGVKKLGRNVGNYIVKVLEKEPYKFDKISFIAHSLGGIVQLYAIKYILSIKGSDYFDRINIKPINLISLASPFLGILNELNFILSWFLDIGTLGKTGRDLTLSRRLPSWKDVELKDHHTRDSFKPVLETLPDDPLQSFLGKFEKLTVYANAINDGIVPLRTAALLYLDYEALGDVNQLKKTNHISDHPNLEDENHEVESNESEEDVDEVPEQPDDINSHGNPDDNSGNLETVKKDEGKVQHDKREKQNHRLTFTKDKYNQFRNLSLPARAKMSKRQKKYKHFSIKGSDTNDSGNLSLKNGNGVQNNNNNNNEEEIDASHETNSINTAKSNSSEESVEITVPPRASAIESAINTLICPIPSSEYIMNPNSRQPVIFHDKYYHFDKSEVSKIDSKVNSNESKNHWFKSFKIFQKYSGNWKLYRQVLIANKYHTNKLYWRKVLVNLPPDAHNNIIVRRRFSNGYGWGVVNHLCENLFDTKVSNSNNNQVNYQNMEKNEYGHLNNNNMREEESNDDINPGDLKAKI
ncbi:uncharacterized protein KGF55_005282 [Candida pseudojiufengensis]|uniref:uncharacterized protein n=1 Tax=Candida pseudojiufengensis TaxID=497109 RepID=UPI0022247CA8|nr:uncharacterized protein KGF55_005282 [Candida pseudojiufengensis]KAI5959638.1 hypothetical protein KGF55_005282 [Candida pseudojiufengensis]